SARQPGWAGADDCDTFPGRRSRREELDAFFGRGIGGESLQPADLHRRLQQGVVHASAFAKYFGGASPSATTAKDVRMKNGLRRADFVLMHDLTNKARNIDVRGTCPRTWGVKTI